MSSSEFANIMKGLKKNWAGAQTEAKNRTGFETIDDGRYLAVVSAASLGESQAGRPQIAWEYAVLEGETAGELIRDYDGLDSEEAIMWALRKLARFGYDVDEMSPEDLPEVLADIVKSKNVLRIRVKTKGEYQHVYVDKVLSPVDGEEEEEEEPKPKAEKPKAEKEEPKPKAAKTEKEKPAAKKKDEPEPEKAKLPDFEGWSATRLQNFAAKHEIDLDDLTGKQLKDTEFLVGFITEAMGGEEPAKPAPKKKEAAAPKKKAEPEPEDENEEEPEDDGDGEELKPGMKVRYTFKGEDYEAEVLKVDEEAGTATCQPVGTSNVHKVKIEKLEALDEEADED